MLTILASQIMVPPGLPRVSGSSTDIQSILQVVFGIIGALAVLFIVIAGLRYVISAGDPQDVKQAKNGIIYAAVGLALAVFGEAIVTWVVGQL